MNKIYAFFPWKLAAGRSGKKDDHGERKHAETEVTAGGKHNTRACKKVCTRKATAGRKNNMHRMGGRPNVGRVRVLVIYCKWMKSLKYINIDT
jgi:hypothetical protein